MKPEMKEQKAIEIITNVVQGDGTRLTAEQDEALASVQKVMKKQIPQKPIPERHDEQDYILCPCCKKLVGAVDDYLGENKLNKFCHNCGQALDWSGEK